MLVHIIYLTILAAVAGGLLWLLAREHLRLMIARKETDEQRAVAEQERTIRQELVLRHQSELGRAEQRAGAANERASQAFAASLSMIVEARTAITDASKLAMMTARTVYGPEAGAADGDEGELPKGMSVGQADRAAARRIREEGDGVRR